MKLNLVIEENDIKKVQTLIKKNEGKDFFKDRVAKNINKVGKLSNKESFWKYIIICLLTSQQNSSKDSAVVKFMELKPFPLELDVCISKKENLENFISNELKNFGKIRFYDRIANLLGSVLKSV